MKVINIAVIIFFLTIGFAVGQSLESGIYLISDSGMAFKLKRTNYILFINSDPVISKEEIELVEQVYSDSMSKEIKSVRIKLNKEGTEKFRLVTKNNINERYGIIVKNELVSAPLVQVEIPNGEISITGNLSNKEVKSIIKGLKN